MLCLTEQVGDTEKSLCIFVTLCSVRPHSSISRRPSTVTGRGGLCAESPVESPRVWTSEQVHRNQNPAGTLCFSDADRGLEHAVTHAGQELFTKRMRTQNISMCGSDGRSSCLRPKPNIHNKDKQGQVVSGSWRAPPPGSLPSFFLPDPLSSTSSLLSSSCPLR